MLVFCYPRGRHRIIVELRAMTRKQSKIRFFISLIHQMVLLISSTSALQVLVVKKLLILGVWMDKSNFLPWRVLKLWCKFPTKVKENLAAHLWLTQDKNSDVWNNLSPQWGFKSQTFWLPVALPLSYSVGKIGE